LVKLADLSKKTKRSKNNRIIKKPYQILNKHPKHKIKINFKFGVSDDQLS
jgi:hypothetical protein